MTKLTDIPDDALNKILNYTNETIQEKIDKIGNGFELLQVIGMLHKREDEIKEQLAKDFVQGDIYEITFEKNCKRIAGRHTGLYLINSVRFDRTTGAIDVARVEPDPDHTRKFGNYKVVEPSLRLTTFDIIDYKVIHQAKEIDWGKHRGNLIGVNCPWMIYPNNEMLIVYDRTDIPGSHRQILYNERMVYMINRYTVVEAWKIHKNKITIVFPQDINDNAPNRSVISISFPKNNCFLLDKQPPHIRPEVY